MPAKKKSSDRRLTLGFLTYHEENDYHNQMMAGIFEAAEKYNANIIHYGGLGRDWGREKLYLEIETLSGVIRKQKLDGLMFLGWIQVGMSPQEYAKYLGLPLFSLGVNFKDIPNVYMDGSGYFKELLLHLINIHGCRRIAFIAPIHWDDRVKVYQDLMKELKIFDPCLFVSAEELNSAGYDLVLRGKMALSILLDERKAKFEAIASPYNDETLSLLAGLELRGLEVPGDVKIIGYEDDNSAKFASTPITTIYYPYRELGYYGCERFIEMLTAKNKKIPFSTSIPGKIFLRRSCGCMSNSVRCAAAGPDIPEIISGPGLTGQARMEIENRMNQVFSGHGIDISGLLRTFFSDYAEGTSLQFAKALELQLSSQHPDTAVFEDFISFLRKSAAPYTAGKYQDMMRLEDILHQARIAVEEKAVYLQGQQGVKIKNLDEALYKISQELITTFNTKKLLNVLESTLQRINIPGCYLFLFDHEKNSTGNIRLVFEYIDNKRRKINDGETRLSMQDILNYYPRGRRYSFLAYLLSANDEYLGLIFFEPGPLDERIYYTLSILISTALRGSFLVEKLESTNRELKATQQELVDKAHKAGMADIAAGTLHNVGNVLNSINTSLQLMLEVVQSSPLADFALANKLLAKNMDNLENFIGNDPKGKKLMQFYLKLESPFMELQNQILYHLNRINEKVNIINEIIIAQQNYAGAKPVFEEIDIEELIEDALKMQSASMEKYNIRIIKKYQPVPRAYVQKIKLLHVLINLFNNAKDAMQDTPREKRQLILRINHDGDNIYIRVTDTGHGIPPHLLSNIFTNGFTTKKDGHGFGLHISANYMNEMGGKIWAESPGADQGATFVLQVKRNLS